MKPEHAPASFIRGSFMPHQEIEKALRTFVAPGCVSELKAPYKSRDGAKTKCFVDMEAMAKQAYEWDASKHFKAVFFTPNPIRIEKLKEATPAKKEDFLERHWLLNDIDSIRPNSKEPATDAEREQSWRVVEAVEGTLDSVGFQGAVLGDSGNGWHLNYPILMPNDDASQEMVKQVLYGLAKRCNIQNGETGGTVERSCHDIPRPWKLYGTTSRKGTSTPERLHRQAWLIRGEPWSIETAQHNTPLLQTLLDRWKWIDELRKEKTHSNMIDRAKAYLAQMPPAISGKNGHDQTYHVACVLVIDFNLSEEDAWSAIQDWNARCEPPWIENDLRRKLREAAKKPGPRGKLAQESIEAEPETVLPSTDTSTDPLDADATAADLIQAGITIQWSWPLWIPRGVLCAVAAQEGTGKTRFCADLARRIYHGLPWPDGSPPTYPKGSRTLWIPADNQHAELGSLCQAFDFPPESLYLNTTKRYPFGGTELDDDKDLRDFERRIKRVKPVLVFVDTINNTTERSSNKAEDAKALFVPLQKIAARTGVSIVCLTHLNAAGTPLGRRITGQVRVVLQLEKPDPEGQPDRRKLHAVKSNSLYPPPLGMTMGEKGNEYDTNPPEPSEPGFGGNKGNNAGILAAMGWLRSKLSGGECVRVSALRTEAEKEGINPKTLYAARDKIGAEESVVDGKKVWSLP